jgi:flagellar biosynthesis protein FliR
VQGLGVAGMSEATMAAWLFAFARMAGWALLDPLLARIPVFFRLLLAAALAAALLPGLGDATLPAPFSLAGGLALAAETLWGAALALCVRLVFAAMEAVLVWFGHSASGGLLMLTAEQSMTADAAWRSLAGWLAAMAFLAANGHLLVMSALAQSFAAMPVAALPAGPDLRLLAEGGAWLFAAGVQLALPLLAFALLLQLALAVLARTVPGADMFSVGLGVAAMSVLIGLVWAMPLISAGVESGIEQLSVWLDRLVGAR